MLLYWSLAFALAWLVTLPSALAQIGITASSPLPWQAGILIGLAPAIAAAAAAAREGRARAFLKAISRVRAPAFAYALALLLPIAALVVAIAAGRLRGHAIPISIDGSLAAFALLWLVLAFGEEIGWRGFALPRLTERFGFWTGSAILGIVWCAWHYPRLLGSPYVASLAEAVPLIAAFSVQIVLANFILCWLYYRGGRSVLVPTVFHATMNVVATAYFMAATDWAVTAFFAAVVVAIAIGDARFVTNLREKSR